MMTLTDRRRPLAADGFSFIELLAYMAIAALLVLAAVPQFNTYRQKAAVSHVQNDLHNAALAMEGVYVTDQVYPQVLPSFKTSNDVTISDPSADPYGLGAIMNLLQVNTGQVVNAEDQNGQPFGPNEYFYGAKGVTMLKAIWAAKGNVLDSDSIALTMTHVVYFQPSWPYSMYVSLINEGNNFGMKVIGSAAPYIHYTVGTQGVTWADAPTVDYTPDSFCLNGSSSQAPGQTWHYDSHSGIAQGAC